MQHSLFWLAILFGLGITVARFLSASWVVVFVLLSCIVIILTLVIKRALISNFLSFVSFFLLGALIFMNYAYLPRRHINNIIREYKKGCFIIKGIIFDQPLEKRGRVYFLLDTLATGRDNYALTSCGLIRVCLRNKIRLQYGDELVLKGRLRRANFLYSRRPIFLFNVEKSSDCEKLGSHGGFWAKRFIITSQGKIRELLLRKMSPVAGAILQAMVLGDRRGLPWHVNRLMMKSGTLHILVVSGFHVGIVYFFLELFLKIIGIKRRARLLIVLPFLVFYCLVTGASVPVVRATVMCIFFILGAFTNREPDIYNSLGLAALCILLYNPGQLFDIGFQLSFSSVLAIVAFYPRLKKIFQSDKLKPRVLGCLANSALISFSAWSVTSILIFFYFKVFSPVTVIANMIIVPLASFIILAGFGLLFVAFVLPFLTLPFVTAIELIVLVLLKVNSLLIELPGAYFLF
ncbi:MAG: ComEC/Rec2 family competence protein [Candidatus Omnitrophota bacterium]|nr:ComEC family competence protein [Candidatus Omnitrophota bacterium]